MLTVPVTLVFATEVAVIVTVNAVVTFAGAVYATPVVDIPDSVPHAAPEHPVPVSVHVTPALFVSLATVAENVAESPGSTFALAGPWILIAVGPEPPPHPTTPVNPAKPTNTTTAVTDRVKRLRLVIIKYLRWTDRL